VSGARAVGRTSEGTAIGLGVAVLTLGFFIYLLLHPGLARLSSIHVVDLTPWTIDSLHTPSKNGLDAIRHAMWSRPSAAAGFLAAFLGVMGIAHALVARAAFKSAPPSRTALIAVYFLLCAPLIGTVPVLSADVFAYLAIGAAADRGENPYSTVPRHTPGIEMNRYAPRAEHGSLYGPLASRIFQWIHVPDAAPFAQVLAFRAGAIAALLAAALALARALGDDLAARRAMLVFLWNPLVLLECVASLHTELLTALLSCAGLLALSRGLLVGLVLVGSTIAIKVSFAYMLPALAAFAWNRGGRGRRGLGAVAAGIATTFGVWLLPDWMNANPWGPVAAAAHFAADSWTAALQLFARAAEIPGSWVRGVMRGLFAVLLVAGVANVRTVDDLGRRLARDGLLYLLFFAAWMLPWYIVAAFPFVLFSRNGADLRTLLVLSITFPIVHYSVELVGTPSRALRSILVPALGLGAPCAVFSLSRLRSRASRST
jgi:hypothetical protein